MPDRVNPASAIPDDAALLRRYADLGDQDAFATLVHRYVDLVHSTALRGVGGDAHLAHDASQHVFIVLARRARALSGHRALGGWLYTAARYEAAHLVRAETRRRAREEKALRMNEPHFSPEPDWEQIRPLLDEAMGSLGARDRESIVMRYFLGLSHREMAAKFGLTEDAARRRIERALDKLHALLARRGVTSTAAALAAALTTSAVTAAPIGVADAITASAVASTTLGGSATVLQLVQIMSTTKFVAGAGLVIILAALGTGIHEIRATDRTESALTTADAAIADANRQIAALNREIHASSDIGSPPDAVTAGPPASAAPEREAAAVPPRNAAERAGDAFLAAHPEARRLWDEREKSQLRVKAGPIYRALDLTPDQIAGLENLVLQQMTRHTTLNTPDGQITLRADPTLTPEEFNRRAHDLLGDKADQLPKLASLVPAYEVIAQLAGAVYRTEPLTSGQIDALAAAIGSAAPAEIRRGADSTPTWPGILAQAKSVLSPTQFAALTDLAARTTAQHGAQRIATQAATPTP